MGSRAHPAPSASPLQPGAGRRTTGGIAEGNRRDDPLGRAEPNLAFYVGFTAFALAAPRAAAFGYLLAALNLLLRVRGDETPAPAAAR